MTRIVIDNVADVGINTDREQYSLPPNAWTSGQNVRFVDGAVHKFTGYSETFASPLHAPYHLRSHVVSTDAYWIYAGLAKVSAYKAGTHADITRATGGDYSATATSLWSSCEIGGLMVLNNNTDIPQYWATAGMSSKLADLTAWPAGYRAKSMCSYRQHLFGLGMTQGGVLYPHRILWSDIADPGAIPASWDIADATRDAGETELSDNTTGGLMRGVELGNILLLYKENTIWSCTPSNDSFIFHFEKLFNNIGLAAQNAVISVPRRNQHFIYTGDDLVVHDGVDMQSVLKDKERRNLVNSIDGTTYVKSFMVANPRMQELWFCYPEAGAAEANKAIIFNYETNVISTRSLPSTPHGAVGNVAVSTADKWSTVVGTWQDNVSVGWASGALSVIDQGMLLADSVNSKLYEMNVTNTEDGALMTSFIERAGLAAAGVDRYQKIITDVEHRKILRRIWPKVSGGPVIIKALCQETIDGAVSYSAGMTFDPATQRYLDLATPVSGIFLGIRIESSTDVSWQLHGYDLEIEVLGVTR